MDGDHSPIEFVRASSVRTEVIRTLASGPVASTALTDRIDASESAVYNALSALEERGLIRSVDRTRDLTGSGVLIAQTLRQADATEGLLGLDRTYWRRHDPGVLPPGFRRRLHVFSEGEVLRADDADPERVIRRIGRAIAEADAADLIAPVYHSRYAGSVADDPAPDVRLVMDEGMLESLQTDPPAEERPPPPSVDIRVREAPFALVVTDDRVLVSLPTVDGEYDPRTELVASTDAALEWGRGLFETWWGAATPLAAFE